MTGWPYPAPTDDGDAQHLVRGLALPALALPTTNGATVSLSGLPGTTVLFVYPWSGRPGLSNPPDWDDIPGAHGSTPEAEGFRDLYPKFKAQGAEVFGVSGQDTDHQREFALRLALPFAILSDDGGALRDALGLPVFETGGVSYLKRLTLLLRAGRILHCFYPVHPPDLHAADVLAWLRANP